MLNLNQSVTVDPIKFLDLEIPVGTHIPFLAKDLKEYRLKKNTSMSETCFGAIISQILFGQLKAYPHNRGKGDYSHATAQSVRNGIKWSEIGEMTYGPYSDPIYYGDDSVKFHLNSFHSRTYGALLRHLDGNMSDSEYLEKISCRYSEKFLETYISFGESNSVHTNNNKIWNANLAFGEHLQTIELNISPEVQKRIGKKKSTVLSSLILALEYENLNKVDWNWWKIYPLRSMASKRTNKLAGEIDVKPQQLNRFAASICEWYKFITVFEQLAGGVDVSRISDSAGIFGFFVLESYLNRNTFDENSPALCVQEVVEVTTIARTLCRGNEEEMQETVAKFKSILKMKLKKKKSA